MNKTREEKIQEAVNTTSWADKQFVFFSRYGDWRAICFKGGKCWLAREPQEFGFVRHGGEGDSRFFDFEGGPFVGIGSKISRYVRVPENLDGEIIDFSFDKEKDGYKLAIKQ